MSKLQPDTRAIQVLFEDRYIIALSKPAMMHCERRVGDNSPSVAAFLADQYPDAEKSTERWEDAGLVQRLDYVTSGVLLAARNAEIRAAIRELSRSELMKKDYLALVEGFPPEKFECSGFIGSPYRRAKKVRVFDEIPGAKQRALPASTTFTTKKQLKGAGATLVSARCMTGRRHQVRAHAGHCGFPLLGDSLYGAKSNIDSNDSGAIPEFFLHASKIELQHPASGETLILNADLPDWIETYLESE
jgi:RluA family pseudouridine synthase